MDKLSVLTSVWKLSSGALSIPAPKKWKEWLPTTEFSYNSSVHSSLGRSLFEALYGRHPRVLGLEPLAAAEGQLETWLPERATMTRLIRQHLSHAQHRIKKQADKHRTERELAVGTMVYLKLQPYVQSSIMGRANQKLSFKFFGPFQVLDRVGAVAYHLDLSNHSTIHLVVHVCQLKLTVGFKGNVSFELPSGPL
jgi:hypothetical protein